MSTMSSLSLDTKVHEVSKSGAKSMKTVRDIFALGSGSTYECLKMMDGWEELQAEYFREVFHPLKAVQDKIKVAKKAFNVAKSWKQSGLYETYASPTEKDVIDAQTEFLKAMTAITRLESEEFRLKKEATAAEDALYLEQEQRIQQMFSEAAPPLFMPAGLQTISVRGFEMPVSPWPPSDTVTVSCNHAVDNHPNPVLTYPKGTKLRVFYMVPDVETQFWCKAVVTPNGCFQYWPKRLGFGSTCSWLKSLPYLYRATMSITLPQWASMEDRVAEITEHLQSSEDPIHEKIGAIYAAFGLESRVLDLEEEKKYVTPRGRRFSFSGVWYQDRLVGTFVQYFSRFLEVETSDGYWVPVAAGMGKVFLSGFLVDHLEDHIKDGVLCFRLTWSTSGGSRSAMIRI